MTQKCFIEVLACLLILSPTLALVQEKAGPAIWNRLPSPVIRHRKAGHPNELVQDGGLGIGLNEAYFSSGQDEAFTYLSHFNANPSEGEWTRLQNQKANKGEYNFIIIEDRCRTEGGCGDIQPDGKCIAVGLPTHAMNCSSLGQRRAFDAAYYEQNPIGAGEWGEHPPRDPDHEAWQGRNSIDDGYGFLYGRYLINEIDCPYQDPTAVPLGPLMEVRVPIPSDNPKAPSPYRPLSYTRPFLDIPYNLPLLRWFACGGIARTNGYKANPLWQGFPFGTASGAMESELDDWTRDHYKTRLAMAVNRLGSQISEGVFGAGHAGSGFLKGGTLDTEVRETAVSAWNALRKMIDRIPGDCSNQDCSGFRYAANWFAGDTVDIRCCETARGSIVEYQPDEERICISPEICNDCEARWDKGVAALPEDLSCLPIPTRGVLRERLHGTNPGYETFVGPDSSGVRRLQVREDGFVRSAGYSPIMVALLGHALIEAECHQRTGKNCLEGWPGSLEARRIEEVARIGQSLLYYESCQSGLCPLSFDMEKKEFVSAVALISSVPNTGLPARLSQGERYFYGSECRGRNGISLNPLCLDMLNITNQLLRGRPVLAKTMALWMSAAPNLDPPPRRTVNGVEGPFSFLPMLSPGEEQRFIPPSAEEQIRKIPGGIQQQEDDSGGGVPPGSLSDSPFPPGEGVPKKGGKK